MRQITALVTGATGMLGASVIHELKQRNVSVAALGRSPARVGKNYMLTDVTDQGSINFAVDDWRPDQLFHLAGSFSDENMENLYNTNLFFGQALLKALETYSLQNKTKVLFVGSAAEYGNVCENSLPITENQPANPISAYGKSKLLSTRTALNWFSKDRHITVARPFNLLGPGMSKSLALGNFFHQLFHTNLQKVSMKTGNLSTYRDFIDVRDCSSVICDLIENTEANGNVVNVCSGHPTAIKDLLDYMVLKSGKKAFIQIDPSLLKLNEIEKHYGCNQKMLSLTNKAKLINCHESIDYMVSKRKT